MSPLGLSPPLSALLLLSGSLFSLRFSLSWPSLTLRPSATIPNGSLHLSCLLVHFPRLTVIPCLARSRARHYSPTYQPARHSRVPPGLLESPHSPMSPRVSPRVPEPTLLACQPTRVPLATARKPTCRPAASLMAVPHSCLSPLATNQPALAYTRLHSPASARASLATRACLPAMAIHPMHPMHPMHPHASHASSCICMYPHVQPVFRPSDPHPVTKPPRFRSTPIPSLSSRGPTSVRSTCHRA